MEITLEEIRLRLESGRPIATMEWVGWLKACLDAIDELQNELAAMPEKIICSKCEGVIWVNKPYTQRACGCTIEALFDLKTHVDLLSKERDQYYERLQFDPGGSDKIDELECAIDFLRHRLSTYEQSEDRGEKTKEQEECALHVFEEDVCAFCGAIDDE